MPSTKHPLDAPAVFPLTAHHDEMDKLMERGDLAIARAHRLDDARNHAEGVCLICGSDRHRGACLTA